MGIINYFAVFLCITIFGGSIFIGGKAALYYNSVALFVVFPGIIGATFLSYPFEQIKISLRVAMNCYTRQIKTPQEVINTLLNLNVRSRLSGILSLEVLSKTKKLNYLDRALSMLIDNYTDEEIKEVLHSEMQFFKMRRKHSEKIFRHMANLSPAFGIVGSVIGLISITSGFENSSVLLENIPIALTSTLYGIVLSYFFFTPIAENMQNRTQKELLLQRIIMAGVLSIRGEKNTYKLETKLTSFITPAERHHSFYDMTTIRNKLSSAKAASN